MVESKNLTRRFTYFFSIIFGQNADSEKLSFLECMPDIWLWVWHRGISKNQKYNFFILLFLVVGGNAPKDTRTNGCGSGVVADPKTWNVFFLLILS